MLPLFIMVRSSDSPSSMCRSGSFLLVPSVNSACSLLMRRRCAQGPTNRARPIANSFKICTYENAPLTPLESAFPKQRT